MYPVKEALPPRCHTLEPPVRRSTLVALTTIVLSAGSLVPASTAAADRDKPPTSTDAAPDSWTDLELPTMELYGQIKSMPRTSLTEGHLSITRWGYRFVSGAGNNVLTVTVTDSGALRFQDRTIKRWTNLPGGCARVPAEVGSAVECNVVDKHANGAFLEVWPRLGNDTIDTSALPEQWRTWVLTDAGTDEVRTGAGRDFINTAAERDLADGGGGDDWIRMGRDGNEAFGGDGDDKLVGGENDDTLHGGNGDDSVGGLAGDDVLHGDAGTDLLAGKVGYDIGYRDGLDKLRNIDEVR